MSAETTGHVGDSGAADEFKNAVAREAIRKFTCPYGPCGVAPGFVCVTKDGQPLRWPHSRRMQLAFEAGAKFG